MTLIRLLCPTLRAFLALLALAATLDRLAAAEVDSAPPARAGALLSAYAHNDYAHPHPLFDALAQGFNRVEADVWLVDGQLLVAHNLKAVQPERTLAALYLDPLRALIQDHGGQVFTNARTFTLLIDVKSAAEPTWFALRQLLQNYTNLLTSWSAHQTHTNSLAIILSGNRAFQLLAAEPLRYAALDGRLADLPANPSPQLVPLISDNWTLHFSWRGHGDFPPDEKKRLRELVGQVHQQGRILRFWAIPDHPNAWRELQSAGVDILGTDDLIGLAKFLENNHS